MRKIALLSAGAGLFLYLIIFSFQKIDLVTADLGRHLQNGALLLSDPSSWQNILHANFYSFTHPSFPIINHHWGSGILFFITYAIGGFNALSILYFACLAITVLVLIRMVRDEAGPADIFLAGLFLIPLIASRMEVRPEGFSYVLIALFLYLLYRYSRGALSHRALFILPFAEVLWANLHIYFIFGLYIVGVFFLEAVVRRQREKIYWLGSITALVALATLATPFGIAGALYPFAIFGNYGYRIVENQSIGFLEHLPFASPDFLWYKMTVAFTAIAGVYVAVKNKTFPIALAILSLTFAALAYAGIRNIALYAMISLPLLAYEIAALRRHVAGWVRSEDARIIVFGGVALLIAFGACVQFGSRLPMNRPFGLGLVPGAEDSALFIKATGMRGPIFNNYDIGGLTIFSLFPDEKVFVDNRPEAYPASFFNDVYIPMQEDDTVWDAELAAERFNMIYFYRLDYTPWAQAFLLRRVRDPLWAPVYADAETIIFLKRNDENAALIARYELPKRVFSAP